MKNEELVKTLEAALEAQQKIREFVDNEEIIKLLEDLIEERQMMFPYDDYDRHPDEVAWQSNANRFKPI